MPLLLLLLLVESERISFSRIIRINLCLIVKACNVMTMMLGHFAAAAAVADGVSARATPGPSVPVPNATTAPAAPVQRAATPQFLNNLNSWTPSVSLLSSATVPADPPQCASAPSAAPPQHAATTPSVHAARAAATSSAESAPAHRATVAAAAASARDLYRGLYGKVRAACRDTSPDVLSS